METIITMSGVDLVVTYSFDGKYISATYEQPAEYPDLFLHSVKVTDSNIDITELLSFEQIEKIEGIIWANE